VTSRIVYLALFFGFAVSPVFAQDTVTGAAAPEPTPQGTVLQGGVRGAALLFEDGLKKMGEATDSIQGSALRVINEVSRKETIAVRGPNYIGNGIVIPALPNASGTMQFGNLPARAKYLKSFMNQATYYVELLQNEVDALIIPDTRTPEMDRLWSRIRVGMQEIQGHLASLKDLTAGPRFNNDKIAREALAIHDGAREINKLRRQLIKEVKPETR
jgi:hypothetical protein